MEDINRSKDETTPLIATTIRIIDDDERKIDVAPVKHHNTSAKYILWVNFGLVFAFSGIQSILFTYLSRYLGISQTMSTFITNSLLIINYGFAFFGGTVADLKLGNFKIICFGLILNVICFCTLIITRYFYVLGDDSYSLVLGLSLASLFGIAVSNGSMKASLSKFLSDQFWENEVSTRAQFFTWFYLSIQFSSILGTIFSPIILAQYVPGSGKRPMQQDGPWMIFSVLGTVVILGCVFFLIPWKRYRRLGASGINLFNRNLSEKLQDEAAETLHLLKIFVILPIFWCAYSQIYSSWVGQAQRMERNMHWGAWNFEIPEGLIISLNPLMILIMVPIFTKVVFPCMRMGELTRIGFGIFCAIAAMVSQGLVELQMEKSIVSVWWIAIQIVFISCAEIGLAMTIFQFVYSRAPSCGQGFITGMWLASLALGNFFSALLGLVNPSSRYIVAFLLAGILSACFICYIPIASRYSKRHREELNTVRDSMTRKH